MSVPAKTGVSLFLNKSENWSKNLSAFNILIILNVLLLAWMKFTVTRNNMPTNLD